MSSSYAHLSSHISSDQNEEQRIKEDIKELQDIIVALKDDVFEVVKNKPVDTFKVRLISMDVDAKTNKDWNTCTLEELDCVRHNLAKQLLIPAFALDPEDASPGCVSITYSIPPSLVTQLQNDIQNTELKVFLDMDIEIITVDGVVCYEAPLQQYTTQLKQLYTSRSPPQPLTDSKPKHLLQFCLARIEKQTISQETWTGSLEIVCEETWMM